MKCKSCGYTIPSALLKRDSFNCPNCGKAYRRSQTPQKRASESAATHGKAAPARSRSSAGMPKWLLPAVAGALTVALIVGILLLLTGGASKGGISANGIVKPGKIAVGKFVETTIEIPKQRDTNYVVAAEANQLGIGISINDKTTTSFDIVIWNGYTSERNPSINWVLFPVKSAE